MKYNLMDKVGVGLFLVLIAVLGFWWVNTINARDLQVFRNYEIACGDDWVCKRNLYYKHNK